MKLFITLLGMICFVIAILDVSLTLKDGMVDGYFHFGTVDQTLSQLLPRGMNAANGFLDEYLPNFIGVILAWMGRQTAYIFFGIIGLILIFGTRLGMRSK